MSNNEKLLHLCVVAPFYNEQDNVNIFYKTLKKSLNSLPINYSLVFVDDGSKDNTLLYLNNIADNDPRVTILSLARNFGHQIAITAGLDYADGDAVVVMDSDLQHPPETIAEMITQFQEGADIVYAIRENTRNLGFWKRITSSLYYWLLQRMTKIQIIPDAPDFRLMSQQVVLYLREMRETHRYVRGMTSWLGFSSVIVYYTQAERYAGKSKYTWSKMFKLAQQGLFSFSTVPLDFIIWMGLTFIVLGFIYLFYIVGRAILINDLVPGWGSVIVTIIIFSGVQLLSIGILAQYIGMVFEQVKARPLYVLKQKPKKRILSQALESYD